MNVALASYGRLHARTASQSLAKRRARTRTLIQAGGLLSVSGLLPICQIEEGEDLQFDLASRDKAAVLLGILLDAACAVPEPPDPRQMEAWREAGIRALKQRAAQTVCQNRKNPAAFSKKGSPETAPVAEAEGVKGAGAAGK